MLWVNDRICGVLKYLRHLDRLHLIGLTEIARGVGVHVQLCVRVVQHIGYMVP